MPAHKMKTGCVSFRRLAPQNWLPWQRPLTEVMFELDDEWKTVKFFVTKEMFLAASLVRWTERFQPKS